MVKFHYSELANCAQRFHAVKLGHHDLNKDHIHAIVQLQECDRIATGVRRGDHNVVLRQDHGQSEDIPHVVIDDQDFLGGSSTHNGGSQPTGQGRSCQATGGL